MKDICKNCGGWKGLHKWDTKQCPFNGEENEMWMESRYEDSEESDRLAALEAQNAKLRELLEWAINRVEGVNNETQPIHYTETSRTGSRVQEARALLTEAK
jgi:hypothetical protein